MCHDDQGVQLDEDGDPPEHALEEHGYRKRPRSPEKPARESVDARRSDRGGQGDEADDEADAAVPVLDERMEVLLGQERGAAARPVVAAEPGPREADRRTRDDDEDERSERDVGEKREGFRREGVATSGDLRGVGLHQASARPAPSTTRPTRMSESPASTKEASRTAPLSAGIETSSPPAVCGSKPRMSSSAGSPSSAAAPATNSRLRWSPPVRRARSATASAPGSAGNEAGSSSMRTPLRSAISWACPNRPKPVTSVTADGSNGRSASAARSL